jgi:hypothetical protein
MIPVEYFHQAEALPGWLLAERAEQPLRRGRVLLSEGYLGKTRSVEAVVVAVGEGVEGFTAGERVLLAHASGDEIRFGEREEKSLWKVPPSNVLAKIHVEGVTHEGMNPDVGVDDILPDYDDLAWEEGDSRGLR